MNIYIFKKNAHDFKKDKKAETMNGTIEKCKEWKILFTYQPLTNNSWRYAFLFGLVFVVDDNILFIFEIFVVRQNVSVERYERLAFIFFTSSGKF